MGKKYSLNGYLNAVLRRTTRTLLVEGVTDVAAVNRLIVERANCVTSGAVVDHSDIFDDLLLKGLGAKKKILFVQNKADELSASHPRLKESLAYLVDREWDGLECDMPMLVSQWVPPDQTENMFTTFGHSVENYHFDIECVIAYLRHRFPDNYSAKLHRLIEESFQHAIALAGAFSCVCRDTQNIGRLEGLLSVSSVELRGDGRFFLAPILLASLQGRGVPDSESFVDNVNSLIELHWTELAADFRARWVLHGHLGSDALWACIGAAAYSIGVPVDISEQISRGHQAERRRYWLTWLVNRDPGDRLPLDGAVDWVLT